MQKFTSRKFLAAIAGIITGLAMVFGLDADVISTVSGAVVAVASVVTYITTEGKIDAEGVANAAEKIDDAKNAIVFGSEEE